MVNFGILKNKQTGYSVFNHQSIRNCGFTGFVKLLTLFFPLLICSVLVFLTNNILI